jgi:hypothetical protein
LRWSPILCFWTASNRWKAALNAFEITFDGRLSAARH